MILSTKHPTHAQAIKVPKDSLLPKRTYVAESNMSYETLRSGFARNKAHWLKPGSGVIPRRTGEQVACIMDALPMQLLAQAPQRCQSLIYSF